jgi:hypothetical protein
MSGEDYQSLVGRMAEAIGETRAEETMRLYQEMQEKMDAAVRESSVGHPITSPDGDLVAYLYTPEHQRKCPGLLSADGRELEIKGITFNVIGTYRTEEGKAVMYSPDVVTIDEDVAVEITGMSKDEIMNIADLLDKHS